MIAVFFRQRKQRVKQMSSSTGQAREWGNIISTIITPLRSHRGKVNRGDCTSILLCKVNFSIENKNF